MAGPREEAGAEWRAKRRRRFRGGLDAVLALLVFEAVLMAGIAVLFLSGVLTPDDLLDPALPDLVEDMQWAVWGVAAFVLLWLFLARARGYAWIYLGVSLVEHGAAWLPTFVWRAPPAGAGFELIAAVFLAIDVTIAAYLFLGAEPRAMFSGRVA